MGKREMPFLYRLLREMLQLCNKTRKVIDFSFRFVYDSTVICENYEVDFVKGFSGNVTVM